MDEVRGPHEAPRGEPGDTEVVLRLTSSARALEFGFVLEALAIPWRLEAEGDLQRLIVPAADAQLAARELDEYVRE